MVSYHGLLDRRPLANPSGRADHRVRGDLGFPVDHLVADEVRGCGGGEVRGG